LVSSPDVRIRQRVCYGYEPSVVSQTSASEVVYHACRILYHVVYLYIDVSVISDSLGIS